MTAPRGSTTPRTCPKCHPCRWNATKAASESSAPGHRAPVRCQTLNWVGAKEEFLGDASCQHDGED